MATMTSPKPGRSRPVTPKKTVPAVEPKPTPAPAGRSALLMGLTWFGLPLLVLIAVVALQARH